MVATDHEISIRCTAPANVEMPGAAVVPARYLADILRKIPSGDLSCEVDEQNSRALLLWQRSQFVIYGFPAREFPQLPVLDSPKELTLPQRVLRDLVRKTNFAVSRDDIRPVLTGALLEVGSGKVAVYATDSYRIAYADAAGDFGSAEGLAVIIPGRALAELQRLMSDSEDLVQVAVGANQLRMRFAGVDFTTRVIDGTYPNCKAVIPREFRASFVAETADFLNACDRASLITRDGVPMVILQLSDGRVRISAQAPDVGSVQEEVAADVAGEELECAFSARYLIEALRTVDTERFTLEISGPASPARLRPVGTNDAYHIILPIRLD
ncbi:MAG: DNA polymerase III subunit beta [Firmicutes bacterium RBG_13_65_8]|nr:MAG: DNA polymerase III subunit beta [Firmicutes bacterium RBG_13_65_8]